VPGRQRRAPGDYTRTVSHGHARHPHDVSADADHSKLAMALALIAGLLAVEVAVAALTCSPPPLSHPAHNAHHAAAIALALAAARIARRPATGDRRPATGDRRPATGEGAITHGLGRAEILTARLTDATPFDARLLIVYQATARATARRAPTAPDRPPLTTAWPEGKQQSARGRSSRAVEINSFPRADPSRRDPPPPARHHTWLESSAGEDATGTRRFTAEPGCLLAVR
jgi:hypothetical protein